MQILHMTPFLFEPCHLSPAKQASPIKKLPGEKPPWRGRLSCTTSLLVKMDYHQNGMFFHDASLKKDILSASYCLDE